MSADKNPNWWDISIESDVRSDPDINEIYGLYRVNQPTEDAKRKLTYYKYLGLDELLDLQIPGSKVPDERIFVITHQLFELTFKQILFDMFVLTETFIRLLALKDNNEFIAIINLQGGIEENDFWRPAAYAANRIAYSSEHLLAAVIPLLSGDVTTGGALFSSTEFNYFRETIVPASGFQSAQLRLIQRALGKKNMLSLRVFPGSEFSKNYASKEDPNLLEIANDMILQEGAKVANPEALSRLAQIAGLDDLAHKMLVRIAAIAKESDSGPPKAIKLIDEGIIEQAAEILNKSLSENMKHVPAEKIGLMDKTFRESFTQSVEKENLRRENFGAAAIGSEYLR
ncbi:MAG: tryptophan 2,3-dioxygenase, partial [Chloroflexota bacterium]